ncbi:MAG TPA: translation initiation factor IF-6, partial [Candidatus Methanomethylophilaceae archaeon]|nr:translation initiation factor IF-6 [Candidatus Methanomethylophilaceae archaeon]
EMAELSGALGVEFSPITLNYGSAMVGACVVANSKGALVGNISTTIELGHLEEALGLY